jgi:hypothetical protein
LTPVDRTRCGIDMSERISDHASDSESAESESLHYEPDSVWYKGDGFVGVQAVFAQVIARYNRRTKSVLSL